MTTGVALGSEALGFTEAPPDLLSAAQAVEKLYVAHGEFVWRTLRRLGVSGSSVEDAVQEVFVVAHRRWNEFEGRSSARTWLFAIARRVAWHCREREARRSEQQFLPPLVDDEQRGPHEQAEEAEGVRILYSLLQKLDEDKRAVFILAELEQMSAQEIAAALGQNTNTIYSRLRLARAEFEQAAARYRARDQWRQR